MSDRPPATGPARLADAGAALLLAVHALLIWLTRAPNLETTHDDARYLLLGRALRGLTYREIWRIDAPIHSVFPPGYPFVLGAVGSVTGDRFDGFIVVAILCSVAALGTVYLALRRLHSSALGLLALVALAANPLLVERAGVVSAEPLYMALSTVALVIGLREAPGRRALWLMGVLAIGAALTRVAGVTIVAALLVEWLLQRRWRPAAVLALVAGALVGGWLLWSARAPEQFAGESYFVDVGNTYRDQPPFAVVMVRRLGNNLPIYLLQALPSALSVPAIAGAEWDNYLSLPVVAAGLVAGFVVAWRRWRVAALYLVTTGALLGLWAWTANRFLLPVTPLLVGLLLVGLAALTARLGRWCLVLPACAAVVLATAGVTRTARAVRQAAPCPRGAPGIPPSACLFPEQAEFFEAVAWVRDSVPDSALVLTAKNATMSYYTAGRRFAPFRAAFNLDSLALLGYLDSLRVSRIVLASVVATDLYRMAPLVERICGHLAVDRAIGQRTLVLRMRRRDEPAGAGACTAIGAWRHANRGRDFDRDRVF